MAKTPSRRKGDPPGEPNIVVAAVVAMVIGVLGGGAFGFVLIPAQPSPPSPSEDKVVVEQKAPAKGRFPTDAVEMQMPPVIVGLGPEPAKKVRIDLSIIAARGTTEPAVLKSEIREDVIAFLKGLTIEDIEGVRGFQNLRQQLDDRAKIRGRGAVLGLLIGGLIVE